MNTAFSIAFWLSVAVCIAGITVISCWLLLDWQREAHRTEAAARMARAYLGDGTVESSKLQAATEYTWPIVAQQPQVLYEKAITIPIPSSALAEGDIPAPRHALEEDADLWPTIDFDREAGLAEWYAADDPSTEVIATTQVHGTRSA